MSKPDYLTLDSRNQIAFHIIEPQNQGAKPGIVFLAGHGSDMEGTKALFLEEWAQQNGVGFTRFDYSGHGQSGGVFLETNITDWTNDAIAVLDHLNSGPQILVGSSLGGWIMLNVALARPDRIVGLVGIAAAPDFTDDLIWDKLTPEQQTEMAETGQIALDNPYSDEPIIYPYHLITDGRQHFRLRGGLDIHVPVRLLHGMDDHEVPVQTSTKIAECLAGGDAIDARVTHVPGAGHRFSEPDQLELLRDTVAELVADLSA